MKTLLRTLVQPVDNLALHHSTGGGGVPSTGKASRGGVGGAGAVVNPGMQMFRVLGLTEAKETRKAQELLRRLVARLRIKYFNMVICS